VSPSPSCGSPTNVDSVEPYADNFFCGCWSSPFNRLLQADDSYEKEECLLTSFGEFPQKMCGRSRLAIAGSLFRSGGNGPSRCQRLVSIGRE